jgi:MerR family transcriptional regulator, thiopeptide resistance regulator
LRRHRDALVEKRARIEKMLAALDSVLIDLEKGKPMQSEDVKRLFDGFDPAQYEDEVKERWGETDSYKESKRRTKSYGAKEWEKIKAEASAIYERIAARMKAGASPTDADVQSAVEEHRAHIDRWFYACSKEMHEALGQMYVADPRFAENLDKVAPGFAKFLSEAIAAS